ncbi:flagellar hook-basal body protein [Lysinibacillus sp. 2017]|uniref:flagellar hook-basal body protein n=1 Tax=unclassified Lysinibacillus TaxID=2636778 RepID=UPI000D52978F|nr:MULTISPECIES: flagellar hook-basal body protein [unclassified Lysinibacillus]AWE06317.1 flagellar hook-basal body protein [Lysinibacillus sp. 2017]TGN35006.1 flagellar hook-basal body protein [Lysinibacillus sp. S2017]
MLRTMITATNTLSEVQKQLDNISTNIANSNTHGYKAQQANFNEMLYQQFNNDKYDKTVRQTPVGIRYGVGAQIGQIQSNQAQGSIQMTERDLDFALTTKNQYFNVLMTDESGQTKTAYTRNGAFYVTPTEPGIVSLVNSDGYPVADANGQAITFPDNVKEFTMNSDGTLVANYPNGQQQNFQLGITSLQKPQVMESLNGGTYIGLPQNLDELGYTEAEILTNLQGANRQVGIQKGALEMSNVDLSQEMTNLIQAQRSYQFNARAVTIADQMLGLINGIR